MARIWVWLEGVARAMCKENLISVFHGWLGIVQTLAWGPCLPIRRLLTGVGQGVVLPGRILTTGEMEVARDY